MKIIGVSLIGVSSRASIDSALLPLFGTLGRVIPGQRPMLDQNHQEEQPNAEGGSNQDGDEYLVGGQRVLGSKHVQAEAIRPTYPFGDRRPDHTVGDRNPQPGEERRQRGRQSDDSPDLAA